MVPPVGLRNSSIINSLELGGTLRRLAVLWGLSRSGVPPNKELILQSQRASGTLPHFNLEHRRKSPAQPQLAEDRHARTLSAPLRRRKRAEGRVRHGL